MKKSKFLFGLIIPILSGCSCSLFNFGPFSWSKYKNDKVAMSLSSEKFENYNLQDFPSLDDKLNNLKKVVTDKGSVEDFIRKYNEVSANVVKAVDCYIIANTKYYATNENKYQQLSSKYYSIYLNAHTFLMNLENDIYHSSKAIKESYFVGMSDEQIEEKINGNAESKIKANYDEEFKKLQDDGQELYTDYRNGVLKLDDYLDQGFDLMLKYVNKANELVSQIPENNYLDYSYDYYYSRDYKYEDTAVPFINYVKEYFVPILKTKNKLNKPRNVDSDLLKVISSYNLCNIRANMCDLFESYADEMGGRYLTAFNNAFKYGYYCFSDNSNSMGTAYEWTLNSVNDAVLFFSRNYQDVLSVTHEFGHYYSCTQNNGIRKNDAYDLQETYSQANEFTFCTYLLEQKKDDSNAATYNYFVDEKIYNSISQIINEAVITEIEQFAFTTPNLTKAALIDGINDILDSYEGTASDTYFMAPILTSPCYYFSYATSLMEALQFAVLPFEDAKETYTKLVENTGSSTMVGRWEDAGLTSPFKEKSFQTLAAVCKDIANKY